MSSAFFEQVADALVGALPPELELAGIRATGHNLKAWFGDDDREHYEVQLLRGGKVEVGFHCEHRDSARNERIVAGLVASERSWRRALGSEPVAGLFDGAKTGPWRRVSEVAPAPRSLDLDGAIELAERLASYAAALEPVRQRLATSQSA